MPDSWKFHKFHTPKGEKLLAETSARNRRRNALDFAIHRPAGTGFKEPPAGAPGARESARMTDEILFPKPIYLRRQAFTSAAEMSLAKHLGDSPPGRL